MATDFTSFVILAGMRTGSNFLEASLNEFDRIHSFGEVFNPHFVGHAKKLELLGMTLQQRDADPLELLRRMKENTPGIAGFRLFHDHDPRVLDHCLHDRTCAKVVLTRNPLESYVSHEIVKQTGQWRLGDIRQAKSARMRFSADAFQQHLDLRQGYLLRIVRQLQIDGQTAFFLDYEDIAEPDVLNGLASFLGQPETTRAPSKATKKQNPQPLEEKIENFAEAEAALAGMDYFGLSRVPSFEPRRGPAVPSLVGAAKTPLLFMPVRGAANDCVLDWMARLDGGAPSDLARGFNQKSLRQWKRQNPGQSFTVVSHPVLRLYRALTRHILPGASQPYPEIAKEVARVADLELPKNMDGASADEVRRSFLAFAAFVRGNLSGQTSVRVDGAWASQSEVIRGMAQFIFPDHIFRESELASDFEFLAAKLGRQPIAPLPEPDEFPVPLADIYDKEVEAAARRAYPRDYMEFGFSAFDA